MTENEIRVLKATNKKIKDKIDKNLMIQNRLLKADK